MTICTLVGESARAGPVDANGTLDELIAALWEGLSADRPVACPICGEEMRPEYGVHARAIGGRCVTCGSIVR